jgi:hypothetical protein
MPAEQPNPRTTDDDSLFQGGNWFSRKMVDLIGRLTPKCTEMTRLLSMEMDRPMPRLTRLKIRAHFLTCCYCKRYRDNLHYIRRLVRSIPAHLGESGSALSTEAKSRMKQALGGHPDSV